MIQKIKDLMKIKEEITDLTKRFDEQNTVVMSFNSSIESLKQEIKGLIGSQNELVSSLQQDNQSLKTLREDLQKEISDFKLMKSRLEKKLVEKFEEEIKKELIPRFERLERHVKDFEDLSSKVNQIGTRILSLSSEIEKFNSISQSLKKGDFELTNFANKLKGAEHEKLELMRKIDTMERLVARQRRS